MMLLALAVAFFFVLAVLPGEVEASTARERAIQEVQDAIRALPEVEDLTEADRPAVEAVLRMAERAMAQYDVTYYDFCTLSVKLSRAESKVGLRGEGARLPTTGGMAAAIPLGLASLVAGAVLLWPGKRRFK